MSSKNNKIIGFALLALSLALLAYNSYQAQKNAPPQPTPAPTVTAPTAPAVNANTAAQNAFAPAPATPTNPVPATPAAPAAPIVPEKIVTLSNDSLRLRITTHGGGLQDVALLNHASSLEHQREPQKSPYLFNAKLAPVPALSLRQDSTNPAQPQLWAPDFTVTASDANRVVLTATPAAGYVITRTYELAGTAPDATTGKKLDPNLIKVTTAFRNTGNAVIPARNIRLNIGTLPPEGGDIYNQFLSVSAYDGDEFQRKLPGDFSASSGFLGFGSHGETPFFRLSPTSGAPWKWVAITNQYFSGIYRFAPATPGTAAHTPVDMLVTPVRERATDPRTGTIQDTIPTATGDVGFMLPALAPNQEITLAGEYYIGPREYTRLAKLGQGEEKTVQFAKYLFISMDFLCKLFTVVLDGLHSLMPASISFSWGLAIILLTLIVKALTWPLVTVQQRSAERMRKFQGPMKAIREKYKDDPRRQQQETMKLYQEHKINPFAGCLPMLIQMPVFIGLFFTFQSLAQLRFQPFLWITDLSRPDLIPGLENFTVLGIHLHLLPFFMGATMLLNMRLSPMPNIEGQQKLMFYGLMFIIPVFCYSMPAALMLYYSVQNVLTIFQTLHTRRRLRREESSQPAANAVIDLPANSSGNSGKKPKGKPNKNNRA